MAKLSQSAWKALSLYLKQTAPYEDGKPGAVIAVQSFDDFQNFHPHLHVLATDGCFFKDGAFMVCPPPKPSEIEKLFRHEVLKFLRAEGKISDAVIKNMMGRHHSGFNVLAARFARSSATTGYAGPPSMPSRLPEMAKRNP